MDVRYPMPASMPNGGTPADRLDIAFRKILTVSKQELIESEKWLNTNKLRPEMANQDLAKESRDAAALLESQI